MKVVVAAGHTLKGYSGYGAVGYLAESEETRKVANKVIELLNEKGIQAVNATVDTASTQNAYLKKQVEIANNSKAQLFICIHFNCFNGNANGVEVYTWKGQNTRYARNVLTNLSALGFKNRGVKNGSDLFVIKRSSMEACLIEVCFIDNKEDVELYKKVGVNKIANAIVKAVSR